MIGWIGSVDVGHMPSTPCCIFGSCAQHGVPKVKKLKERHYQPILNFFLHQGAKGVGFTPI